MPDDFELIDGEWIYTKHIEKQTIDCNKCKVKTKPTDKDKHECWICEIAAKNMNQQDDFTVNGII